LLSGESQLLTPQAYRLVYAWKEEEKLKIMVSPVASKHLEHAAYTFSVKGIKTYSIPTKTF